MKRSLISGVVVVLVLSCAAAVAYKYVVGSKIGGPCQLNSDCQGNLGKFGTQCFDVDDGKGGFCTATCDAVADCPSGWSCDQVDYFENDVKKGTSRVCVKPAGNEPAKKP